MKNKTKYRLLGWLGGIACVAMIAWGAIGVAKGPLETLSHAGQGTNVSATIQKQSFDKISEIDLSGVLDVTIEPGSPNLEILCDPESSQYLKISCVDGVLVIQEEPKILWGHALPALRITTNTLDKLHVSGTGSCDISGIDVPALAFRADGALNIEFTACNIKDLTLDINGTVKVDALQSHVANAHVLMNGLASVKLGMDGGVLDGSMDGLAALEYSGTVSAQNVKTNDSLVKITDLAQPLAPLAPGKENNKDKRSAPDAKE